MQTVEYDSAKLVTNSLVSLILCPALGIFLCFTGGFGIVIGLLLLLGGPFAALGTLRKLFVDSTALRYDHRTITINAGLNAHTLSWADVADIDLMTMTIRMYGVIPVNRQHFIDFKVKGGVFGSKKLRLPVGLLGMSKEAGAALVLELDRVRKGAANSAVAPGGFGAATPLFAAERSAEEAPSAAGDFDADAVMAAYLAKRDQRLASNAAPAAAPPAPVSRVAGFGRKGL